MNPETRLRWLYGTTSVVVLAVDQVTKYMISSRMALYSTIPVIPGLIHLTLVNNTGALFGLFRDLADPYRRVIFTAVPLVAIILILFFQCRTNAVDRLAQSGLALIMGGAVGNLIDRVRLGHVVDFVDVFVGEYHWPAFNVADSSICIGVTVLFIDLLRKGRETEGAGASPGV